MANEIKTFSSERFGSIRALALNDDPWFVARDACDALRIATNHLRDSVRWQLLARGRMQVTKVLQD